MDKETNYRLLYRDLRSLFNRLDLRIETFHETGSEITYVPRDIVVRCNRHSTLLENRIQCLVDIAVALGLQESCKTGERLVN